MAATQLTCARIGLVSGRGLAGATRRHYPRWFLYGACLLLLAANVFNIAADLAGMADAAEMLTGVPSEFWVPLFGLGVIVATVYTSYARFAAWLKWLTAVLFAYILSAVLAQPNWSAALRDTLVPHVPWDARAVPTLVGILGTTISPYLFFWQASQEVEEERAKGRRTVAELFAWRAGLDLKPSQARRFYLVLGGAIVAGVLLNTLGLGAIRMLFLSAIINGLLAPPLMLLVMLVGNNRAIMGTQVNGVWLNVFGWGATAVMTLPMLAFLWTVF